MDRRCIAAVLGSQDEFLHLLAETQDEDAFCLATFGRRPVDHLADYEGISVFYAAGPPEAQLCGAERVAIVGGGNSAGQAAVWLSRGGALVTLLHRRSDLR